MKHTLIPIAVALALAFSTPALAANCYADYKAKKGNPLRLHYGVIQIVGACSTGAARKETRARLKSHGWKLLNVISVFGPGGLEKRKPHAGYFYLRF